MFTAIRWFANNSVAANLLMIMLLVGGGLSLIMTNQEEIPMFEIPVVRVGVPYLGAAPVEVAKRNPDPRPPPPLAPPSDRYTLTVTGGQAQGEP